MNMGYSICMSSNDDKPQEIGVHQANIPSMATYCDQISPGEHPNGVLSKQPTLFVHTKRQAFDSMQNRERRRSNVTMLVGDIE